MHEWLLSATAIRSGDGRDATSKPTVACGAAVDADREEAVGIPTTALA